MELHEITKKDMQATVASQEEELHTFKSTVEAKTAEEAEQITSERMKLERTKGHLDLDRQHLEQAEEKLESLASEKTAIFVREKDRLVGSVCGSVAGLLPGLLSNLNLAAPSAGIHACDCA